MTIDNKLLFNDHINCINHKVSQVVAIMTKLKHILQIQILQNIYFALIHSNLLAWGHYF